MPKTKEPPPTGWDLLATYCPQCDAACCKYFAFEIDEPDCEEELDKVYWFLCHEGTMVFVDEGKWFLQISNKCRYLQPDGRCGVYDRRPQVCRDYGLGEDGQPNCEFTDGDYGYELEFRTPEAFLIYRNAFLEALAEEEEKERRKRARARGAASPRPPRRRKETADTLHIATAGPHPHLAGPLPRKMNRKARRKAALQA
ncbi:YkgJ family cysteine cluster protein [bacterium]|nr:YkgJ family cysteine cluster protein [bacterium]